MKRAKYKILLPLVLLLTVSGVNADQVLQDDSIVVGSQCIGLDCANGENFGFDTLRFKENNVRLKFIDTSSTSSFPGRDWQITINDSINGGANYFAIEDVDGSKVPFKINADAPNNTLNMSSQGNIGFGTANPLVNLHTTDGNSPTLRLEQDGSSGFTSQTWDVGGNESNFFVRDTTHGGNIPFRIEPNTPFHAFHLKKNGALGLGTGTPDMALDINNASIPAIRVSHLTKGDGGWELYMGGDEFAISQSNNGVFRYKSPFKIKPSAVENSLVLYSSKVSIGTRLEVAGDLDVTGNIISLGSVFNASDRNLKENIKRVKDDEILNKVDSLNISFWNYKTEDKTIRHIGPMAQDFYKIFKVGVDNKHISTLDAAAVAIASVKALHHKLQEKDKEISSLQTQIEELKDMEQRMTKIETLLQERMDTTTRSNVDRVLNEKFQDSEDDTSTIDSSVNQVAQNQNTEHLDNGREPVSHSE